MATPLPHPTRLNNSILTLLELIGENMETKKKLLENLNETVSQLVSISQGIVNPKIAVYEGWTTKDILGHITFWHESFARNVRDLANDKKPTPLKGKYSDLTQRCLAEFKTQTIEDVITRLKEAHRVIQENILNPKLRLIPYKIGSRDYTPEEHLEIVNEHIKEHMEDIVGAQKSTH